MGREGASDLVLWPVADEFRSVGQPFSRDGPESFRRLADTIALQAWYSTRPVSIE